MHNGELAAARSVRRDYYSLKHNVMNAVQAPHCGDLMRKIFVVTFFGLMAAPLGAYAQDLPPGPGSDVTTRVCTSCHGTGEISSERHDAAGWGTIVTQMVAQGASATDDEQLQIIQYLAATYSRSGAAPAPAPAPVAPVAPAPAAPVAAAPAPAPVAPAPAAPAAAPISAAPISAAPNDLILPPGFHATIVADGIAHARHLAIRANGDIYVSTRRGATDPTAGVVAIRLGPDHKAVDIQHFSDIDNGTGIRIAGDKLYTSSPTAVYRFDLSGSALVPAAPAQVVIEGMPTGGQLNRVLALDGKGNLFLSVSGSGNLCTAPDAPQGSKPVGLKPCPSLTGRSGIWRFDAAKVGQHFPTAGEQLATGVRDIDALDYAPEQGALYAIMHDRNGASTSFPDIISAADEANVAEEMHRITKGVDLGWPYTYYDGARKMRLLAPEYGGDGKTATPAGIYDTPAYAFAGHQAPLDMLFYEGKQFPAKYRGGAFVVFHGGNGPHLATGRQGYNVSFVPFDAKGNPGTPEVFADGFAGVGPAARNVDTAAYRPVGAAVGPDGALYVADGQKGRIWRITYSGK